MLLPNHGLTGYYLYPSEKEIAILQPIKVVPSETRPHLKKRVYDGTPKETLIEETVEHSPINFEWHSEDKKSYKVSCKRRG